jgi:TRAP-type C4-dicarboxylate transport system permease small subunit
MEILYYFILALIFGIQIALRLTNPDMSETRFFIEFWYLHLPSISLGLLVVSMMALAKDKKKTKKDKDNDK